MTHPLVSVITPTANRPEMLRRCVGLFLSQDYANKELIIISDTADGQECWPGNVKFINTYDSDNHLTIGEKLNIGMYHAKGIISMRMDDDDLYASDWINLSVNHLLISGADIVGLSNACFYDTTKRQTYELRQPANSQLVLCGATLCYHRRAWERKPFPDTNYGEDMAFLQNNGRYECHGYKEGFTAIVHGNNTICHRSLPLMHRVNTTPPLVLQHLLLR